MSELTYLEELARQVRRDVLRMVHRAQSGHPGGALSSTDYLTTLFFGAGFRDNPSNWRREQCAEDLFFLSNGHLSALLYSILARKGYFPVAELASFRQLGSRLQGHPSVAKGLPGVRIASGSLGQGLSVACGAALAKRYAQDSHLVYSLHGDGELQEGQIWEAALFASAKKIDNLIAAVDYNHIQIDGTTEEVLCLGDLAQKWRAFGWQVLETDGHSIPLLQQTLQQAKQLTGKGTPIVILLHTHMGQGVDFMLNKAAWHGKAPNNDDLQKALDQLPTTQFGDF